MIIFLGSEVMILEDNKLYVLFHWHEYGDDGFFDEEKILGVFSSKKKLKNAIKYYSKLDGFKKYEKSCFVDIEYEINKNTEWLEGFITWEEAYCDNE